MLLSEFESFKDLNILSESEKLKYIEQLKREHFLCGQMEATAKTELVSIYGALGNENYAFYNPDIAEAITLQGQDAIKFSEKMTNDYFMNHFHLDFELHKHLEVPENYTVPKIKKPVVVYCDTDSTAGDTIINTSLGDFRIDEYFDICAKKQNIEIKNSGHEIVKSDETILNFNGEIIQSKIKNVIRHKVTKKKYRITASDGKVVEITGDHSIIVLRDSERLAVTVADIKIGDKLITIFENSFTFVNIINIEQFDFVDEYVYDIEIDTVVENEQSFFGNGILLHNSNYCSLDEVLKAVNWQKDPKEMALLIYEHRLKNYFNELFVNYIKELNGMGNYLKFEMETISSIGLFIAKKKYIHSMVWKDGVHIPDFSNLKVTGLEIVQRSTPIFCRTHLKDSVKKILKIGGLATGDGTLQTFIHDLKEIKKAHKLSDLEHICKNNKISNYHKFVINDKETLEFRPRCPIHIKAAATFNHLVSINNLCDKYEFITTGDSVKWYYTSDKKYPVFGFPSGKYPEKFAPKYDYKMMFEKTFVDVINRFINAMIANTNLDYSLSYTSDIF
jgi:hypothetical protein